MGVRNRKKSSAKAMSEKKSDDNKSAAEPPPYTTGVTDCLMFLALLGLLGVGIQLVLMSMEQRTPTESSQDNNQYLQSSSYDCHEINEGENIVQNGQVHARLQQIAHNNPHYQPHFLAKNVVQFDNLLSAEECENLIAIGKKYQFQESRILDRQSGSTVEVDLRTSTTLWCLDECEHEPVMQTFLRRLHAVLDISLQHFEPIQLLQYQVDQFYGSHSDFASREIGRRAGPRVFTLLFYLNDVAVGGETYFGEWNVTVTPRPGRVILWSNCENDNLHQRDAKAFHEALPVKEGSKYAGNVWIHLRNYREPLQRGCLQEYEEDA